MRYYSLLFVKDISSVIYFTILCLALRNFYVILIKQKNYKNKFLVLQYISTLFICVFRILAVNYLSVALWRIKINKLCKLTVVEAAQLEIQDGDVFFKVMRELMIGMDMICATQYVKICFGVTLVGTFASLLNNLNVIHKQSGAHSNKKPKLIIYLTMIAVIALSTLTLSYVYYRILYEYYHLDFWDWFNRK